MQLQHVSLVTAQLQDPEQNGIPHNLLYQTNTSKMHCTDASSILILDILPPIRTLKGTKINIYHSGQLTVSLVY